MPVLAGYRKALAIGGRQHAAPPAITQGEVVMIVDESRERGRDSVLPHIPRGAPGQLVIGNIGAVGHLLQAEITGMRQDTGIEMGQQGGPQRVGARRMEKVSGKARPAIDLNEEVAEFHLWETLGNMVR